MLTKRATLYLFSAFTLGMASAGEESQVFRPDPSLWTRDSVPVYATAAAAEDQEPGTEIATLPAATRIQTSIVNVAGKRWSEWAHGDKPRPQVLAAQTRGEWTTDQTKGILLITAAGGKRIKGYVPRDGLTAIRPESGEMMKFFTPTTPATAKNQLCWSLPGFNEGGACKNTKPACKDPRSTRENVMRLLREFHNTRCDQIHQNLATNRDLRQRLIQTWEDFIEAKRGTEDETFARAAQDADILARTVLHEGHRPSTKAGVNSESEDCEWKVIAQSIQNRRHDCKGGNDPKKRGCRKNIDEDLVGVATQPSEINIWMSRHVLSSSLTSCYLRDDLSAEPTESYRDLRGKKLSAQESRDYATYLRAFPRALAAAMAVLGLDDHHGESEAQRRTRLFEITNVDNEKTIKIAGRPIPVASDEAQSFVLARLVSYYHPHSMPACDPRIWKFNRLHFVRSSDIRCEPAQGGRPRYVPMIRERVQLLDANDRALDFDELGDRARRLREKGAALDSDEAYFRFRLRLSPSEKKADKHGEELVDSAMVCNGARINIHDLIEPNESFACLPGGVFPQCGSAKNAQGRQVSINLVSPELLRQTERRLGPGFVSNTQIDWNNSASRTVHRRAVGINCRGQSDTKAKTPSVSGDAVGFAGLCDSRMTTIAEFPR